MSQLSICLLGSFQVHLAGQLVTDFSSNKTRALLTHLTVEVKQPHQRARLADLFWPDWPEEVARTYLRQSLANLRHILPNSPTAHPYFLPDRQTVQFNPASDYYLDMDALSQALSMAHLHPNQDADGDWLTALEQASAAYRGDFLDGFFLNGCPAFEEWQMLIREQCRRNAVDAFGILRDWYEQAGEYSQALAYARRQSTLEPLSEEAHRQLLRLLLHTEQRHSALQEHDSFTQRLREQLGIEPTVETLALAAQIRSGDLSLDSFQWGIDPEIPSRPVHIRTEAAALPVAPTPLVGREKDVAAITALFSHSAVHLVTLTGPAGVGKSRLALEVANALRADFPDGIAYVRMDVLGGADRVADGLVRGLGLSNSGRFTPEERVRYYLQQRRILLLLDSFEQVMEARGLLGQLLMGCPGLHLLVTSREVLHLQAEHLYPVEPLALPAVGDEPVPESLIGSPALQLFVQRAQATRPDFALTHSNAAAVAELCIHLDGLPLAIELAAARCALLPIRTLLEGLSDRFRFLRGGAQDAPDRHQTLHRAISWSYDLLTPVEQALFRRMAFFAEGCTLEEVAAVCTPNEELGLDPLEGIASLLDKSLVQRKMACNRNGKREPRYGMLESIRAFGLEKLRAEDELTLLRCRHTRYADSLGLSAVD